MQVRCADIENPDDFDGFQIALWRKVAEDMGWAPEDWTFTCVDWTAMIDDLTSPDGLCSFAAAGG
jgi:ABC-type amino acid transport substrate-binding protein